MTERDAPVSTLLFLDGCTVDAATGELRRDDEVHHLTEMERALLAYLAHARGREVGADELLREVWGYRDGVASRTVVSTVHRLRKKIERNPSEPAHLLSRRGGGYRLVAPEPAPIPTAPVDPDLVERRDELSRLRRMLRGPLLVTVVGPGGVGKTRLARELSGPGSRFVSIAEVSTSAELAGLLAAGVGAVGRRSAKTETLVDDVAEQLRREKPDPLILDNAEQCDPGARKVLARWAATVPVLVTSREPLGVPGEQVLRLPPLSRAGAMTLFARRAAAACPGLNPGSPDQNRLEDIVRRLDHLPLAIELVAARLGVMSLQQLHRRLQGAPARSGLPDRLVQTVQGSWDLLSEDERRVLLSVAVFEGGFTLEAAEWVLDDLSVSVPEVLGALISRSLLRAEEDARLRVRRLYLYEPVRLFVRRRLEESGQVPRLRRRHASFYARLAEPGRGDPGSSAEARAELFNLLAAGRNTDGTLRAAAASAVFAGIRLTGPRDLLERVLDAAMEEADELPPDIHLRLISERLSVHRLAGEWERARRLAAAGEELLRDGSETEIAARFHEAVAGLELESGHPQRTIERVRRIEALDVGPERRSIAKAHFGSALAGLGRLDEAVASYEQALSIAEQAGLSDELVGRMLGGMGALEMARGRLDRAAPYLERGLVQVERSGLAHDRVGILSNLGCVLMETGRSAEAEEQLMRAEAEAMRLGLSRTAGAIALNRAVAAQELGGFDRALVHLGRGASLLRDGDRRYLAIAAVLTGGVHQELGWLPSAEESYARARTLLDEIGDRMWSSLLHGRNAALAAAEGRAGPALEHLARAEVELPEDDAQARAALDAYRAVVVRWSGDAERSAALLRRSVEPVAGWSAPSPAAWSTEARFARRLYAVAASHAGAP